MRRVFALLISLTVCGPVLVGTQQSVPDSPAAAAVTDMRAAGDPVPDILVSRQLVESQGLAIGDVIELSAEPTGAKARSFRIVGMYEPVPNPARFTSQRLEARLHLPDLLDLTDDLSDPQFKESVGAINVALADPAQAREFRRAVRRRLPGLAMSPTSRSFEGDPFEVLERFHLAIAIVTILASSAFLLALMVMRSDEHRETAAILRLIGFRKSRVLLQVFIEGLLIAVTGAAVGIVLAIATQGGFNRFFQWRYDTALIFVRISPGVAWRCIALAVPLGVVASIVASWTLLRREILALLRR